MIMGMLPTNPTYLNPMTEPNQFSTKSNTKSSMNKIKHNSYGTFLRPKNVTLKYKNFPNRCPKRPWLEALNFLSRPRERSICTETLIFSVFFYFIFNWIEFQDMKLVAFLPAAVVHGTALPNCNDTFNINGEPIIGCLESSVVSPPKVSLWEKARAKTISQNQIVLFTI